MNKRKYPGRHACKHLDEQPEYLLQACFSVLRWLSLRLRPPEMLWRKLAPQGGSYPPPPSLSATVMRLTKAAVFTLLVHALPKSTAAR